MAIDSTLAVRNAALKLLKADAGVTALVPKARIFTQWTPAVPPYPFIRMGPPSGVPMRASCLDGLEVTLAIHGFANEIQPSISADNHAGQIGAAIAGALDRKVAVIPGGKARFQWTGPRLVQDPHESKIFHTIQSFRIRCVTI